MVSSKSGLTIAARAWLPERDRAVRLRARSYGNLTRNYFAVKYRKNGLAPQVTLQGTKYYKDGDLTKT